MNIEINLQMNPMLQLLLFLMWILTIQRNPFNREPRFGYEETLKSNNQPVQKIETLQTVLKFIIVNTERL